MNILVLGGTGAMGAPLSKLLVASGNNVYVTSRSAHKSCERLHYLQGNAKDGKHTIFRLDAHYSQPYLCAVTFNNNDYGKRKSKLSGGI